MSDAVSVNARIKGRVQGVWYRAWTVEQATARGLNGWVRNRADGSVEAVFSGVAEDVADMLKACSDGPAAAVVTGIETADFAPPEQAGFRQLATL